VKVEALKEENHKLVVMETRLRGDYERKVLSTTSEYRYKDRIFSEDRWRTGRGVEERVKGRVFNYFFFFLN
jgi:hypothetical protein